MNEEKAKAEYEKVVNSVQPIESPKKNAPLNLLCENDTGETCYYRDKTICRRYPPTDTQFPSVEGNCLCGEYLPIKNLPK